MEVSTLDLPGLAEVQVLEGVRTRVILEVNECTVSKVRPAP